MHLRDRVLFVVDLDPAVCEPDVARVVASAVLIHSHETQPAGGDEGAADVKIVDWQIGVAIEDVECLAKQRSCPDERTAGAQEAGTVGRIVDMHSKLPTIAIAVGDHLPKITHAKNNPGESGLAEKTQLMGEKRLPRDIKQQFGHLLGQRSQPGGEAPGEDGNWKRRNRRAHERRNR